MTIEQQLLEKLRDLPPEKQKEVLDFVDSLKEKKRSKKPRRRLLGLWADLNGHITEEVSPKPAVRCGVTFLTTSSYERGARCSHCVVVTGKFQGIVNGRPHND